MFLTEFSTNSLYMFYSFAICSFVAKPCQQDKDCNKKYKYSRCQEGSCTCEEELILGKKSCEPGKDKETILNKKKSISDKHIELAHFFLFDLTFVGTIHMTYFQFEPFRFKASIYLYKSEA